MRTVFQTIVGSLINLAKKLGGKALPPREAAPAPEAAPPKLGATAQAGGRVGDFDGTLAELTAILESCPEDVALARRALAAKSRASFWPANSFFEGKGGQLK